MENSNARRQRLYFIDIARFICFLPMIYMNYAETLQPQFLSSGPGFTYIPYVWGTLFGATGFMFLMGFSINLSKGADADRLIKRGLLMLALGYLLNIARSLICYSVLAVRFHALITDRLYWNIFNIDIFHFAGMALMLLGLLIKIRVRPLFIFLISLLMIAASSLLIKVLPVFEYENSLKGALPGSLTGLFYFSAGDLVCFPLLNWFVFPAAGYFMGYCFVNAEDKQKMMKLFCFVFLGCFAAAVFVIKVLDLNPLFFREGFFMQGDLFYCIQRMYEYNLLTCAPVCFFCFFFTALLFLITYKIEKNAFLDGITCVSGNVTRIYVLSWLLIYVFTGIFYPKIAEKTFNITVLIIYLLSFVPLIVLTIRQKKY